MTNNNSSGVVRKASFPCVWKIFRQSVKVFISEDKFKEFLKIIFLFMVILSAWGILVQELGLVETVYGRSKLVEFIYSQVYFVVSMVLGLLYTVALIHVSHKALKGQKLDVMKSIKYSWSRLGEGIVLGLRVFWYVLKWVFALVVVLTILLVILRAILGSSGMSAYVSTAFAASGSELSMYAPNIVDSILFVAALVCLTVVAIVRGTKSMFSFYAFVVDGLKKRKPLDRSLDLVKGNFWEVLGSLFMVMVPLYVVVIGPVWFVLHFVGSGIFSVSPAWWEIVLQIFVSGILGGLITVFLTAFYLEMKKFKKVS